MVECKTDEYGTRRWYINGKLHREDGPAVERKNGDKYWYKNGEQHREDGPAVEMANGTIGWYTNGKTHREDGPAVEYADGDKWWYLANERLSFDNYCIKLYGSLDHPNSIMLQVKYG